MDPERVNHPNTNDLLTTVNTRLRDLGVTTPLPALPEVKGLEVFRQRRVVMVDDSPHVVCVYLPLLFAACAGFAEVILHTSQSLPELSAEVFKLKPELVLVDWNLARDFKGGELVAELVKLDPALACIGFSSDTRRGNDFVRAGASGFVPKLRDAYEALVEVGGFLA